MNVELSETNDDISNCGVGAKLLKDGSGSAVSYSEGCSVSPPRARKVAAAKPEQDSQQSSGKRVFKFKTFDVAFPNATEHEGGRILFCFDKSCTHESKNRNVCESVEDYFLLMEDKCILDHNCLGRVKSLTLDKHEHMLKPAANGYPRRIGDLLT